jgi:hypothetical protein
MKHFSVALDDSMASKISQIGARSEKDDAQVIGFAVYSHVKLHEMLSEPGTELVVVKRNPDGSVLNEKVIVLDAD